MICQKDAKMTCIYLDESGDLGFGTYGSRWFITTAVKINDERTHTLFRRIPKRVRERQLDKKTKKQPELKFSNSSPLLRERFLMRAAKLPIQIFSLIIEKKHTNRLLQNNLPVLYNYLTKLVLEQAIATLDRKQDLTICLDKCMSPTQRENFELYVKTEFLSLFNQLPQLKIIHESSAHNECLQVVDFICGAFGYKYNTAQLGNECETYTSIIKKLTILEKKDLFKENANHTYLS